MKKTTHNSFSIFFCTCILLIINSSALAQSPNAMSYQSVIRNAENKLIVNHAVGMQISILQGSVTGASVYVETHRATTNSNGLVSIEIGNGYVMYGDLTSINWNEGPYFIKTETDPAGQDNYTITGISQLLSVPFAMHATTAKKLSEEVPETDPEFSAWDKSEGIIIYENQISNLSHFTNDDETDPLFASSPAAEIADTDIENWNNHTVETDPEFSAWDKSEDISISESQISDLDHFSTADETDPFFDASAASEITTGDVNNWNSKSTFSGDYSDLENKPTSLSDFNNDVGYQKSSEDMDISPLNEIQNIYGNSRNEIGLTNSNKIYLPNFEADPLFNTSPAKNINNSGSGAVISNSERLKLNSIEAGGEVNVQADWLQTNIAADDFIRNKPDTLSLSNRINRNTTGINDSTAAVRDALNAHDAFDRDLNATNELITRFEIGDYADDSLQISDAGKTWSIASKDIIDTLSLSNRINKVNAIHDADNDTKIQTEENTDEDIIRIDVAGNEAMTIDGTVGTTIKLPTNNNTSSVNITKNNGTSVFKVNGAGQISGDGSGLSNVRALANYVGGDNYYDITANYGYYNNIKQISIAVPTAGKIIVNAGGCLDWESKNWDLILYSILGSFEGDPNISYSSEVVFYDYLGIVTDYNCTDSSDQYTSFSSLRGFTVNSGGTYTFILWANKYASTAKVETKDVTMSVMYFPTRGSGPAPAPYSSQFPEFANNSGILTEENIIDSRIPGTLEGNGPPLDIEKELNIKKERLKKKLEAMRKQAEKNNNLTDLVNEQAQKIEDMQEEIKIIKALLKK